MNREDIIRMADQVYGKSTGKPWSDSVIVHLEAFAKLVAAAEREECAKVCDDKHYNWRFGDGEESTSGPKECAETIRARSYK